MKCTNCGCTELFKTQPFLILFDSGEVYADYYACIKCGHVETFVPKQIIDRHNADIERKKQQEQEEAANKLEIEKIKKEMAELNKIIEDENQTVKVVNQAKSDYKELSDKLKKAIDRQNSRYVGNNMR